MKMEHLQFFVFELVDDVGDFRVVPILGDDQDSLVDSSGACNAVEGLVEDLWLSVCIHYDRDVELPVPKPMFIALLSINSFLIKGDLVGPPWLFPSFEVVAVKAVFSSPLHKE